MSHAAALYIALYTALYTALYVSTVCQYCMLHCMSVLVSLSDQASYTKSRMDTCHKATNITISLIETHCNLAHIILIYAEKYPHNIA